MNAHTTIQIPATVGTAPEPSGSTGHRSSTWLSRALAGVLATVVLTLASLLGTGAGTAHAATGGAMTTCFRTSYNIGYGTQWGPYQYAWTYPQVYVNGSWRTVNASARADAAGCAYFSGLDLGYSWRMCVDEYHVGYRVVGCSNWATISRALTYNLGTTYLYYY